MLIQRIFKPWASCSKDAGREVLHSSYLDVNQEQLISTDGRILSRLPVAIEEGDVSGLVPADALKAAMKLAGRLKEARLDCTSPDAVKLNGGRTWPRSVPGGQKFPTWEQVLPKNYGRGTVRIQFNPELLYRLFEAMGSDERAGIMLEFQIDDEHDAKSLPVLVTSAGMECVLMPFKTLSRAPNRVDDVEAAHAVALGEKDINAVDAEKAAS